MRNPMCEQAWSLPELLRTLHPVLERDTRLALRTEEIFSIQRIVLTGCGDSYAAGLATKHIFELLTGIPTEVVTALDLARYYHPAQVGFAPHNPLVIAVSSSGTVARLAEAAQFAREHGAFVLAVTANPDAPLGRNASRILPAKTPPFASAPGVRSYLTSVLALLLLAVRIGEVRGKYPMDRAGELRQDFLRQADGLEKLLPEMDRETAELAKQWSGFGCFDFVGGGFDYAAAFYGHAKILEAAGRPAMRINTEEWLHLNFFARDVERIGTVITANTTNPAVSRSKEVVRYAGVMGRPTMVVTDGAAGDFENQSAVYVQVPATKSQIGMPLTQFVPMALLAGYLAEELGETYGRNCEGPWSFAQNGAGVRESEIIIRRDVLK